VAENRRRTLRFGDLRIRVASADPRDLVWLGEFLRPAFLRGPDSDADCTVRLTIDAGRHARRREAGAVERGRAIACFALDTTMVYLPSSRSGRGELTIYDREFDVFYLVRKAGGDVEVLGREPDLWRGRIPLMRVVRELAMNHAIANGGVLVHGAAIRLGARVVVVAGPKRAGKTTMLTWLLGEPDARYIANDRVLVRFDDCGLVVRGVPTIVTLRASMLRRFPRLHRRVRSSSYHSCLSLREADMGVLGRAAANAQGRFGVSPAQYLELTGARAAEGGRLHALVFPRLTHRRGRLDVRRLTVSAALKRLRKSLFRAASPRKASEAFALSPAPSRHSLEESVRRLAASVPCFECQAGSQAYDGRRNVTRLRAECL
jgi:hypothetical protein